MAEILSTAELEQAYKDTPYPKYSSKMGKDEYARLRQQWRVDIAALETRWRPWLFNEYLAGYDLPESLGDIVFTKAWDDGHSAGYHQVESEYQSIAEFARTILETVGR